MELQVGSNEALYQIMMARYYSSSIGRFIAVDPMGGSPANPQSWNRYAYVLNNPLRLTDPNGMCSAPAGGTGFCIEGFIAAPRINKYGFGNNRTFSATDGTLSSKVKVMIATNSALSTFDVAATPGFSAAFKPWLGLHGTASTSTSNGQTMADGTMSFTLNVTADNGLSFLPGWTGAPQDPIDMSLNLAVTPCGVPILMPGSVADGYPSIGIYGYSGGVPQTLYQGGEGSPSDLAPPMERQIAPWSGKGSFFSSGSKPSRSAGGYVDEDGTHWSIQGASVR